MLLSAGSLSSSAAIWRHNARQSLLPPPRCRQRRLSRPSRGDRAQRKTGHPPHRLQRGGPHSAFIHQPVEGLQMLLFLLGHVAGWCRRWRPHFAALQHRKLAFINAAPRHIRRHDPPGSWLRCRAQRRAPAVWVYAACLRLNSKAPVPAIRNEKIALYAASDRPNRLQVTALQLTSGAGAPEPNHIGMATVQAAVPAESPIAGLPDKRRSGPTQSSSHNQPGQRACIVCAGSANQTRFPQWPRRYAASAASGTFHRAQDDAKY